MELKYWPKSEILELFRGLGVKFVTVSFEGGGDSGDVNAIRLYADNPETTQPQMDLLEATGQSIGVGADLSYLSLIDSLSKPVYDKYYGFDGDPYVSGSLTWDIATGGLKMEGEESQTVSEGFCDEEVGYESCQIDNSNWTVLAPTDDQSIDPAGDTESDTDSDGAD